MDEILPVEKTSRVYNANVYKDLRSPSPPLFNVEVAAYRGVVRVENILPVNIETWGQGGSQRGIPSTRSRDFDNTTYCFELAKFRPSTVADPKDKHRFRMRHVCLVGPRHWGNVEANGSCV